MKSFGRSRDRCLTSLATLPGRDGSILKVTLAALVVRRIVNVKRCTLTMTLASFRRSVS